MRLKIAVPVLVALSFAGLFAAWCGEAPPAKPKSMVKVRGLRVTGSGYGGDGERLWPFDCKPGTTLALLVTVPEGGLVDFDELNSRLASAVDAGGKDLIHGGSIAFTAAHISTDRKACMLLLRLPKVPKAGSGSLRIKGVLVMRRATKKLKARKARVPLAAGNRFKLAGVPFEITAARRLRGGPNQMEISVKSSRAYSCVDELRFVDAEGKVIRAERWAGGYYRKEDQVLLSFALARAVGAATLEIDYWGDMKPARVPFDLKVTLGL